MLQGWLDKLATIFNMTESTDNPYGCGTYLKGSGESIEGFTWYYRYLSLLTVVKCDLVITRNIHVRSQQPMEYFAFRLDYAKHLPPGKTLAFYEDKAVSVDIHLRKGMRIAYTEVIFSPRIYKRQFKNAFISSPFQPEEILKGLSADYNWNPDITHSLIKIRDCSLAGPAAELFYIGESCKILSSLLVMGSDRLPHRAEDYEDIQRVLQYIDENHRGTIYQEDLLRLVHMSPTKLKTLFRTFTKSSITDYILEKKMETAIQLLADTTMSIDEIGHTLGFSTPSGFSASFKKRIGQSPSSYRKQLRFQLTDNASYYELSGEEDFHKPNNTEPDT